MTGAHSRRVVVTGAGSVSAWGWGIEALWRGLTSGRDAFRTLERFDPARYPTQLAGEVPAAPREALRAPRGRARTLADRFGVAAAVEASDSAGLSDELLQCGAAVFFGSSTGGMYESEEVYRGRASRPIAQASRRSLASQPTSAPAEAVARALRVDGPVETISSACSSGTLAIGLAADAVREGTVRVALAGGADSLCRVTFGGFNALGAVDARPCRPFRADRAGLTLGEGAAVLVLEGLDSARARGARPLAELLGFGASGDAYHMTAPDPTGDGPARALAAALGEAGLGAERIDFVNAHGTGTPLNDAAEFRALARVFGEERARRLPVTATKASVGHLLGSAGALEALVTVLCLSRGTIAGTPGGGTIDAATPLDLVLETRREDSLETGVSLNLAFGGCNAALVFGRFRERGDGA